MSSSKYSSPEHSFTSCSSVFCYKHSQNGQTCAFIKIKNIYWYIQPLSNKKIDVMIDLC
jgi:hypothetical protein